MSKTKKPDKENYFGEKEEKAVIEYLSSSNTDEKNYIYTKYLHEPIEKLVKGLLQKYPRYVGSCGIDELEARAYIQVYNAIQGFDYTKIGKDGKNVKAFSYLGTICNNYYKTHSLQANKKESINDDIGQYNLDYIEQQIKDKAYIDNDMTSEADVLDKIVNSTIEALKKEIKENKSLRDDDIKVAESIILILVNYEYFFYEENDEKLEYTKRGKLKKQKTSNIYTKNKIFYILKEQTRLDTKDIRKSIMKFKSLYFMVKKDILG